MPQEYEVTGTAERERLNDQGEPEMKYIVWIRTVLGVRGSVVVKPADWNAETLPGILAARATELDLAHTL